MEPDLVPCGDVWWESLSFCVINDMRYWYWLFSELLSSWYLTNTGLGIAKLFNNGHYTAFTNWQLEHNTSVVMQQLLQIKSLTQLMLSSVTLQYVHFSHLVLYTSKIYRIYRKSSLHIMMWQSTWHYWRMFKNVMNDLKCPFDIMPYTVSGVYSLNMIY